MNSLAALALPFVLTASTFAAELQPRWLVTDQTIYADDFSKPREIGGRKQGDEPWAINQGTRWEVSDGVLRGRASSADYQAKHDTHKGVHPRIVLQKTPEKYVLRFSMRIVDGTPFVAGKRKSVPPFIEIGHHICRVTWDVNGATLLADGDTTQLANDKAFKLVAGQWQDVMIERRDDEVLVQFAGGPVFHGRHASYVTDPHAVMLGGLEAGTMEVDNVTLWSVKDGTQPAWTAFLAKLPPQQNLVLRAKTPGRIAAEKRAAEEKAKAATK